MVGGGWRVSSSLARRVWHRADDGVLYVPPHVFDVPWAASHEPRSGTSHPRVAKVDESPSGYSGLLLSVWPSQESRKQREEGQNNQRDCHRLWRHVDMRVHFVEHAGPPR